MNKTILIGNLGKDPELSYTQSGQPVCKFSLATRDKWKDKSGEWKDITDWHNIVVWGKLGETISKYLNKGSQVAVEGKSKTRKYADKSGGPDRYITEVVVHDVQFLDSKRDQQGQGTAGQQNNGYAGGQAGPQGENLPF